MTDPRVQTLLTSETYWTARALREQGSRFYRALGDALDAADLGNRRRLYEGWTQELWDFYERGLRLEEGERRSGAGDG
ncbi:hypothetical protein [Deinococcus budaensis]|uniref:Uncharacterized protein n=1 Tax=Deinococcus budaensis TaxID=1665626 RepID=A0A7W8LNU7_9DEIO|nr:hypothetical protein [Deinococcus budaensis]MBB5233103.1 hypothetical protein [Deinococcus budaensis]